MDEPNPQKSRAQDPSSPPPSRRFRAHVSRLANDGYGVATGPDAKVYFVRGTWPGDEVLLEPSEERAGRYQFAELVALLVPSPDRRAAPCPHHGLTEQSCGGCPWMIAPYQAQLRQKQHRVRYTLERAGWTAPPLREIWPSPAEFGYRRRVQFKTDGTVIGYAGRQGRSIAPITDCQILTPTLQDQLQTMLQSMPRQDFRPGEGYVWNFFELDEHTSPDSIVLNRRRPFQQAHAEQNARMQAWIAARLAMCQQDAPLLELFAGSGNFTRVASSLPFPRIKALEVAAAAVEALQALGLERVEAQRSDLYQRRSLPSLASAAAEARTLLVNPPRAGLEHLTALGKLCPLLSDILYVSCDMGTLARDLQQLRQVGFDLLEVQPLDQMPQTAHVEVLVHLRRPKSQS